MCTRVSWSVEDSVDHAQDATIIIRRSGTGYYCLPLARAGGKFRPKFGGMDSHVRIFDVLGRVIYSMEVIMV